ncbi:MAG: MMPL family transporter [Actinomycetes bacterium]
MNNVFAALGRFAVKWRWPVVVVWLLATGAAVHYLPSLSSVVQEQNASFLPSNAPSNQAAALAAPLQKQGLTPVLVVATSGSGAFTTADQQALASMGQRMRTVPTVAAVRDAGLSPDGQAGELVVQTTTHPFGTTAQALVNRLNQVISQSAAPAGFSAHLTGGLVVNVANEQSSGHQANQTQGLSIVFILVLLLIVFRSLLAPLVTLLPAALVVTLSGPVIAESSRHGVAVSSITQILLVVLVLGAGTDYGLFLVFRVREELRRGLAPREAIVAGLTRVGESITFSAGTVIVALLSLLLASFGIYHDLGIPLAIGIGLMLLAGLTLLPALLAILGRAVFWPSSTAPRAERDGLWGRVSARLVHRPVVTLVVGVVAFGALALFSTGNKASGFGGAASAPAGSAAAAGQAVLDAHFPAAGANPTNLVFRFTQSVWTNPAPLAQLGPALRHSAQFTGMLGPLNPNGTALTPATLVSLHERLGPAGALPPIPPAATTVPVGEYEAYRATSQLISADGHTVMYLANLTAGDPGGTAALDAVPAIRAAVTTAAHDVGASASGVAGEAPGLYDVSSISSHDLVRIVPIAALLIGILLALVLRSLVAPLYLIVSVVLSYLAALGLTVLVFMDIGGQDGLSFILPFLMFIFLLALGEDYNILVMTRIREEAHHLPLPQAIVRAVGRTGTTVTSAGLVLAGTFAVLAVAAGSGPQASQFQAIGVGLGAGVLMDTFLVRTVLVPATVALLGRWNWWPSTLAPPDDEPEAEASVPAEVSG